MKSIHGIALGLVVIFLISAVALHMPINTTVLPIQPAIPRAAAYNYQVAISGSSSGNMNSGGSYVNTQVQDGSVYWIEASTSASLQMTLNFNQLNYAGTNTYSIQFLAKALTAITNDYNGNDWIQVYDKSNAKVYENDYVNYNNALQTFTTTSTNGISKVVLGVADFTGSDQYLELDCDYVSVAQVYFAPTAPQTVNVQFSTNSQAYLTWSAPASNGGSDISSYTVLEGTQGSGSETSYDTNIQVLHDTITVVAGTTYYFEVEALNAYGTSVVSTEVSYAVANYYPSQPTALQIVSKDAKACLNWSVPQTQGGSSVTSYNVYRSESTGTETLLQSGITTIYFNDTNVQNQHTYFYEISALNSVGEGVKSDEASILIDIQAVPIAPTGVTALYNNGGYIVISYDAISANPSVQRYDIYRSTTTSGQEEYVGFSATNTYNDLSVLQGITYYYQVTAINSLGESPRSAESSALAMETDINPSVPLHVVDTYNMATGVDILSWSPPQIMGGSAITTYAIFRGSSVGQETLVATIAAPANNSWTDTNASAILPYYYYIEAENNYGLWSNPTTPDTMTSFIGPGAVTIGEAGIVVYPLTLDLTQQSSTITLSWTAVQGAIYYIIYMWNSTIISINSSLVIVGNVTSAFVNAQVDISSFPNGLFYFAIGAEDAGGNISLSNTQSLNLASGSVALPVTFYVYIGSVGASIVAVALIAWYSRAIVIKRHASINKK